MVEDAHEQLRRYLADDLGPSVAVHAVHQPGSGVPRLGDGVLPGDSTMTATRRRNWRGAYASAKTPPWRSRAYGYTALACRRIATAWRTNSPLAQRAGRHVAPAGNGHSAPRRADVLGEGAAALPSNAPGLPSAGRPRRGRLAHPRRRPFGKPRQRHGSPAGGRPPARRGRYPRNPAPTWRPPRSARKRRGWAMRLPPASTKQERNLATPSGWRA